MNAIKLHFVDFSSDFNVHEDHFYKLLTKRYNVVLDENDPDYLIYSCYGYRHLDYDCVRIFYTAENIRPDFNLCDFAIGFDYMMFGDRYLRFPNYARYGKQYEAIASRESLTFDDLLNKTKFCNFIYSNGEGDPTRDKFFQALSDYKAVDSPGRHLNNMISDAGDRYSSAWRNSKVDFQKNYKFTIAFENSSTSGYTTEKIMHAFAARTIPIYWGNPEVAKEFNPGSFVNCHDYRDMNHVIERISQIDNDDNLYLKIINESCFLGGTIPYSLSDGIVLDFFEAIFSQSLEKAYRRPRYGSTVMYEHRARLSTKKIEGGKVRKIVRRIARKLWS